VDWNRKILSAGKRFRQWVIVSLVVAIPLRAANDASTAAIAVDLGEQVKEIANTGLISREKKEKRIATTVRIAVVAATAYHQDRGEVGGIAVEMAAAASRAAPAYADVIARAVAFVPAVARYAGAAGEVRAAAMSAARNRQVRSAGKLVRKQKAPAPAAEEMQEAPAAPPAETAAATEAPAAASEPAAPVATEAPANTVATAETPSAAEAGQAMAQGTASQAAEETGAADMESNAKPASISSKQPLIPLGDNASLTVSTDLGVRRDTNVFLSPTDKQGATILSVTPGAGLDFGQNSLFHGLFDYHESFNRYSGNVAPNVNLASASGDLGYNDGSFKVDANGQYQQLYQNNIGILSITGTELIRSNVTNFGGSVETPLFSKMAAGLAVSDSRIEFVDTPGLYGNTALAAPFNLYYGITPKVDLSIGYTFTELTPDQMGAIAKGNYYNVGARGNFTSKLSGGVTVGYQTEQVPGSPVTHDLGLTSDVTLEITPKTSMSLKAVRDFADSAQGQVIRNGSYSLNFKSDFSDQWQMTLGATYRTLNYGPELYTFESALLNQKRIDEYWEGNFQISYIITRWLSATAGYLLRDNRSTLPGVEFSDDVFSLDIRFQY
jgi:hypothetical protein